MLLSPLYSRESINAGRGTEGQQKSGEGSSDTVTGAQSLPPRGSCGSVSLWLSPLGPQGSLRTLGAAPAYPARPGPTSTSSPSSSAATFQARRSMAARPPGHRQVSSTSPARRPAGWRAGSQPGDPEARAGERGPGSRPALAALRPRLARPGSRAPAQLRSVKGPPLQGARARSQEVESRGRATGETASRLLPPKTPSCHPPEQTW